MVLLIKKKDWSSPSVIFILREFRWCHQLPYFVKRETFCSKNYFSIVMSIADRLKIDFLHIKIVIISIWKFLFLVFVENLILYQTLYCILDLEMFKDLKSKYFVYFANRRSKSLYFSWVNIEAKIFKVN